jgi:hypothetical protein
MLLDADLTGLTVDNISSLAAPVLLGDSDVSLSLRKNSLMLFRAVGLDFISGERVIRKELLSEVLEEVFVLPRFGVEVFINRKIIARQLSISVTHWLHVTQSRKAEKLGYWKGFMAEWRMIGDLFLAEYPLLLISQIYHLLLLRTNRSTPFKSLFRAMKPRYNAP